MERYKVIQILKFYNDIDGHIAFARSALEDYTDKYYGLHGGNSFGDIPSKSNKISNPTDSAVPNTPDSVNQTINELRSEIKQLEKLQAAILTELCKLPPIEKNILTYFYFKGFQWVQISSRVNYSGTQCKKIRSKALEKLGGFFDQNEVVKNFSYPY